MTRRSLAALMLSCVTAISCHNSSAASSIGGCESTLFEKARRAGEQADVPCSITQKLWVVALPNRGVGLDELQKLGLPEPIALAFSKRGNPRSEWCAVRELPHQPQSNSNFRLYLPDLDSECVGSRLSMAAPFAVQADRVNISAVRVDANVMRLVGLSATR